MSSEDYFRKQARTLRGWARTCFDMKTAENPRKLAAEFEAWADNGEVPEPYMRKGNGHDGGDMDRD